MIYARNASIVCEDINSFLKECEKIVKKKLFLGRGYYLDKLYQKTADSSKRIIDEIEKYSKIMKKLK